MDLPKFLSFLQKTALFFCRADILEDQYEGRLPRGKERFREGDYKELYELFERSRELDHLGYPRLLERFREWFRQWTYVNCWHASSCESAAMWAIYGISGQSIAIETTYERLRECLPGSVHLGLVEYIDYENYAIPENYPLLPFLFKRESFRHEVELRALFHEAPKVPGKPNTVDTARQNCTTGKTISVDLNQLILKIHVGPKADEWYFDVIQNLVHHYHLLKPILRSSIDASTMK
jgi:hypothetical protein